MTPTLTLSARIIGLAAALIFALLAALAPGAKAELKTFPAVSKTERQLVFAPKGISAEEIRGGKLEMRSEDGRRVVRNVSAGKIREAVERRAKLVLRRPSRVRSGKLKVSATTEPSSPSTDSGTSTDSSSGSTTDSGGSSTADSSSGSTSGSTTGTSPTGDSGSTSPVPTPTPTTAGTCDLLTTTTALAPPGACWRPYSDASPFNRQVPADAPVVSNSSAIVQRWIGFGSNNSPKFEAGNTGTSYDYDHPIYYSQPTDPVFTVHCTKSWGTCEVEGMQVRIPDQAKAAGGGDGHMAVIDVASGWEYDFWQVASKPAGGGTLNISWGGRTRIGTTDADGLGSNATAAHFGLAAGVIRPQELAAGEINHALFMVVNCTNGRSVAPSGTGTGRSCSSIGQSNTDAPAMGQHFVLDMSDAEIDALNAPTWQKAILRAMAHYGLYVGDTGGGFFKLESGASYTSFGLQDPWMKLGRDLGVQSWNSSSTGTTKYLFDMRNTVDWASRMKVVDPCVAQGTC